MDKEKTTYLNVDIDKFWILAGPTKISPFFVRSNERPYPMIEALRRLTVPIIIARGRIVIKKTVCIKIKDNTNFCLEFLIVLMDHLKEKGEKLYSLSDPGTRFNFEPESIALNYKLDEEEEGMELMPKHYTFINNPSKYLYIKGYKRQGKYFDDNYCEIDWLINEELMIERKILDTKNEQLLKEHLDLQKIRLEKKERIFDSDDGW